MSLKRVMAYLAVVSAALLTSIGIISGKLSTFVPVDLPGHENAYVFTDNGLACLYEPDNPSNNVTLLGPVYW